MDPVWLKNLVLVFLNIALVVYFQQDITEIFSEYPFYYIIQGT